MYYLLIIYTHNDQCIFSAAYVSVKLGDTMTLPCYSSSSGGVEWRFSLKEDSQSQTIYSNGRVIDARFRVSKTTVEDFSLTLNSVELDDSGMYSCVDDMMQHTVQVIVYC